MRRALEVKSACKVEVCFVPLLSMPKGTDNVAMEKVELAVSCVFETGNAGDGVCSIYVFTSRYFNIYRY